MTRSALDANRVEELRYQLELFIDGTDRRPDFLREVATVLQEILPGDEAIDAFVLSATVFGDPACSTWRTVDEMVRECQALRRHLAEVGP